MTELGVFAKYWLPGSVKTRLGITIGHRMAAQLHKCFVSCICRRFANIGERRWLATTPAECLDEFQGLPGTSQWNLDIQKGNDLGDRMANFFRDRLAYGSDVVLLGSDSPNLPLSYLEQAFDALKSVDVVLGPSADGGYYLLGMSNFHACLFEDMPWSTNTLFEKTLQRLNSKRISFRQLPQWYDVDEISDLQVLHDDLKEQTAPEFAELLELLHEIANDVKKRKEQ